MRDHATVVVHEQSTTAPPVVASVAQSGLASRSRATTFTASSTLIPRVIGSATKSRKFTLRPRSAAHAIISVVPVATLASVASRDARARPRRPRTPPRPARRRRRARPRPHHRAQHVREHERATADRRLVGQVQRAHRIRRRRSCPTVPPVEARRLIREQQPAACAVSLHVAARQRRRHVGHGQRPQIVGGPKRCRRRAPRGRASPALSSMRRRISASTASFSRLVPGDEALDRPHLAEQRLAGTDARLVLGVRAEHALDGLGCWRCRRRS